MSKSKGTLPASGQYRVKDKDESGGVPQLLACQGIRSTQKVEFPAKPASPSADLERPSAIDYPPTSQWLLLVALNSPSWLSLESLNALQRKA